MKVKFEDALHGNVLRPHVLTCLEQHPEAGGTALHGGITMKQTQGSALPARRLPAKLGKSILQKTHVI